MNNKILDSVGAGVMYLVFTCFCLGVVALSVAFLVWSVEMLVEVVA